MGSTALLLNKSLNLVLSSQFLNPRITFSTSKIRVRRASANDLQTKGQSPRDEKFVRFAILRTHACSVEEKNFKKEIYLQTCEPQKFAVRYIRFNISPGILRTAAYKPTRIQEKVIDRCSNVISEVLSLQ